MSFPKLMTSPSGDIVRFTAPGKGIIMISGSGSLRAGLKYDHKDPECIEELMSEFVDYNKGVE